MHHVTQQQQELWAALLPFGGSVLLFIAAMITLAVTIKSTNSRAKDDRDSAQQRAVDDRNAAQVRANADREAAQQRANADRVAARQREFDAWRRDTLLKVGFEAMEASTSMREHFQAITYEKSPEGIQPHLDAIEAEKWRVGASFFNLRLIGAHGVAERCRDINNAMGSRALQEVCLEGHREFRRSLDPENPEREKSAIGVVLLRQRLETLMEPVDKARETFGDLIELEINKLSSKALEVDSKSTDK